MKPKIVTTLQDYSAPLFAADALAGVTVAMVAIPLSIAIAIASGATPAAGLVTPIVGGLLISLLGGSRVQIGGPTGAFIVVVYSVIADHGSDGLVLATLMAGAILVVAGLLILTAWNMTEPHKWRSYGQSPIEDRALLLLTLALTVVADLTVASMLCMSRLEMLCLKEACP